MADIFPHSPYSTQWNTTYTYTIVNTSKYGDNSLRVLGGIIWNSLPNSVKYESLKNI